MLTDSLSLLLACPHSVRCPSLPPPAERCGRGRAGRRIDSNSEDRRTHQDVLQRQGAVQEHQSGQLIFAGIEIAAASVGAVAG